MTIKDLQTWGYKQLSDHVFSPEFETDALLSHVLKKDRSYLYAHPEKKLTDKEFSPPKADPPLAETFKQLIKRRKNKEPFAYLVGKMEFYNLEFKVSRDVLIPRPETEGLVAEALKIITPPNLPLYLRGGVTPPLKDKRGLGGVKSVIDVGTGSGAILISVAANTKKKLKFFGIDISSKALTIARHNAKKLLGKLKDRSNIKFIKGDLLAPIKNVPGPYLVVANLPYLTPEELEKEELKFEPKTALYGGDKGLEIIEKLIKQFAGQYRKGDILLLEIGYAQAEDIKKLANKLLPDRKVEVQVDFSGYNRIVKIF